MAIIGIPTWKDLRMSKYFNDEEQPVYIKINFKCPKCEVVNVVSLGFEVLDKKLKKSQPNDRTWDCKNCKHEITIQVFDNS